MNLENVILDYEKEVICPSGEKLTINEGSYYVIHEHNCDCDLYIHKIIGRIIHIVTAECLCGAYCIREGYVPIGYIKNRILRVQFIAGPQRHCMQSAITAPPGVYDVTSRGVTYTWDYMVESCNEQN